MTIGQLEASISLNSNDFVKGLDSASSKASTFGVTLQSAIGSAIGYITGTLFVRFIDSINSTFNKAIQLGTDLERSFVALDLISERFGVSAEKAKMLAKTLGEELRIGTNTASTALQDLIMSGLNLDEAADLLRRFTNEAILGKSANISLSQAVQNLAFAYKTENSALGNLSGISENFSDIMERGLKLLQQEGKLVGKKLGQLSDQEKAMVKYKGMIDLTNLTMGASAKLQGTLADKTAFLSYKYEELATKLGIKLNPILSRFLDLILKIVESEAFNKFVDNSISNLEAFGTFLDNTGKKVNENFAYINSVVQGFSNAFMGVISRVSNIWNDYITLVNGLISNHAPILREAFVSFEQNLRPLIDAVLKLGTAIWNILGPAFSFLWELSKPILYVIGTALVGAFYVLSQVSGPAIQALAWGINWVADRINQLNPVVNYMTTLFKNTFPIFQDLANKALSVGIDGFNRLANAISFVLNSLSSFANNIRNSLVAPLNIAIDVINSFIDRANQLINATNKITNKAGITVPNISRIPKLFTGTKNFEGGLAVVGEKGPELVSLPKGSKVNDAYKTSEMVNKSVVINNYFYNTQVDESLFNRMNFIFKTV